MNLTYVSEYQRQPQAHKEYANSIIPTHLPIEINLKWARGAPSIITDLLHYYTCKFDLFDGGYLWDSNHCFQTQITFYTVLKPCPYPGDVSNSLNQIEICAHSFTKRTIETLMAFVRHLCWETNGFGAKNAITIYYTIFNWMFVLGACSRSEVLNSIYSDRINYTKNISKILIIYDIRQRWMLLNEEQYSLYWNNFNTNLLAVFHESEIVFCFVVGSNH